MNSKESNLKNYQKLIRKLRLGKYEKTTIQRTDNNILNGEECEKDKSGCGCYDSNK